MLRYDLKGVKGKIWTTQKVVILPFMTIEVKGAAKLTMHSKSGYVILKPIAGVLRPGVGKVDVWL